ncbi:BTAD domain-containing putative transcriptional regulator [Streptomyces sp. NPDC050617]|uniref:AfsR/SARP family transcriptional regulator n=1 Tax=Streptomyces sp. NPDC050617 TaxID=3154628 RepID=UPI003447DD0D
MDFEVLVLGPVDLRVSGRHDGLGSAKGRTLLAALAVDAGRPVPLDTLIHRLWDHRPPAKPRASLHAYACKLRRRFRDADGCDRLVQQAHAYALDIDPDTVDCHRYRRLTAQARAVADSGDDTRALALFQRAEGLWRGEPLAGLTGLWADSIRASLEERHLAAILNRASVELRMGRYADLVGDLSMLLEQHPTDETLVGMLMAANYGCGRQADALRTYEATRRRLSEELGTDPGEPLRRVYQLILNQAPARELLAPTRPPAAATTAVGKECGAGFETGGAPSPTNLPTHAELVGREAELRTIVDSASGASSNGALRAGGAPGSGGAVIALQAISGMAGVGKSLLALHAARRLSAHYPGGLIHLDLRAHSPNGQPLTPAAALTTLLRLFGVESAGAPRSLDELTSRWRTLLSSRRAVIILDDAAGPAQIRPLLPAGSSSLIIITSRRRLAGVPGVRPVFLDLMPHDDAITLFTELVGTERTTRHEEVAEIVRLCGHLPLAIELAAGRLISRPSWTTRHLIQRLSRSRGRLDEIRDAHTDIARVFELSYNALTTDERTVFRLLGLRLGPTFDVYAAAALTGLTLDRTERVLESLLDAHLLQEPTADRFTSHDLLSEYSLTLAAQDPAEERSLARKRLISYYLAAADEADRLIHPRRPRLGIGHEFTPDQLPSWEGPSEAKSWLTVEHGALIAAEAYARSHGNPCQAAQFGHVLAAFLDADGYWAEGEDIHQHAAQHWRTAGVPQAEARALADLATTQAHAGRYAQAAAACERALSLARAVGDTSTVADALQQLAVLHWYRGQSLSMLSVAQEALELSVGSGDRWNEARSRNNMGIAQLHLGNPSEALRDFQEALTLFRAEEDERGQLQALNNSAEVQLHIGERESARQSFTESLAIARKSGSRAEQGMAQLNLANAFRLPEELNEALQRYQSALICFRNLGDRRNETITVIGIGIALYESGQYEESANHHRNALELARGIGAGLEEGQSLRGLGAAERRLGHATAAADHLTAALKIACEIHSPEDEARACAELAEVRAQTGRREAARALWQRARRRFEGLDPSECERLDRRIGEFKAEGPEA